MRTPNYDYVPRPLAEIPDGDGYHAELVDEMEHLMQGVGTVVAWRKSGYVRAVAWSAACGVIPVPVDAYDKVARFISLPETDDARFFRRVGCGASRLTGQAEGQFWALFLDEAPHG